MQPQSTMCASRHCPRRRKHTPVVRPGSFFTAQPPKRYVSMPLFRACLLVLPWQQQHHVNDTLRHQTLAVRPLPVKIGRLGGFRVFDTDRSGSLEVKELQELFQVCGVLRMIRACMEGRLGHLAPGLPKLCAGRKARLKKQYYRYRRRACKYQLSRLPSGHENCAILLDGGSVTGCRAPDGEVHPCSLF